jgi:hypothetical protein
LPSTGPCDVGNAKTKTSPTTAAPVITMANLPTVPIDRRFRGNDGTSTSIDPGSNCSCSALATASAKISGCLLRRSWSLMGGRRCATFSSGVRGADPTFRSSACQ